MTAKGRETLRDVAMIVSLVISLCSVGGVMMANSNASAQWVQRTDSRLKAIEDRNALSDKAKEDWRKITAQAIARANYLCITNPQCEQIFGRMETE